ncbi:uncharacterized protein [Glycine max]|uniref:Phosphoglycerate mutase family protein n=2 Tax=Glycine subgen. Soja TaxID=1462606 RepID=I1KJN0_SOYBN|nr:uncharacterized protein LOC100811704 isoform X2 [Glycine max]RZC02418.1 hypothetical protein D0Y65_017521 [Glycine soja]|eukprot:XP_014633406.1 uncharacterized protein LOC100811704 isoform X2 [Glycine max]
MASSGVAGTSTPEFYQNVVVMRHGDRIDNFEPMWVSTATRPWDPPLIQQGRVRAFATGRKFRNNLPFTLHRVFVSPFLRCIQTAAEVVVALSAIAAGDDPNVIVGDDVPIDPSKLKVSVEYGLCEMMSRDAIRLEVAPKDGNWGFDVSEREAMLPAGTVDKNVERVYKEGKVLGWLFLHSKRMLQCTKLITVDTSNLDAQFSRKTSHLLQENLKFLITMVKLA